MAGELTAVIAAVKGLMEEIATASDTLSDVWTNIPNSLITASEAVVLMTRGRHGQFGTSARGEKHYLGIIIYMRVGTNPQEAEDNMATLWNLMVDKFNAHIDLAGTVKHSRLEDYRMGWETISGDKCRRMICALMAHVIEATAYSLS